MHVLGTALHVEDLGRSIDFYTNVLGMQESARYELESFNEVVMSSDGGSGTATIILVERPDHSGPYTLGDGLYKIMIDVDDVRLTCERVVRSGGTIEVQPTELPAHGVTMAMVLDIDGYRLELLQVSRP
jgi:lactoylglutathione lyase